MEWPFVSRKKYDELLRANKYALETNNYLRERRDVLSGQVAELTSPEAEVKRKIAELDSKLTIAELESKLAKMLNAGPAEETPSARPKIADVLRVAADERKKRRK